MRSTLPGLPGAVFFIALFAACGGGGSSGTGQRQSLPPPANQYYSALNAIWAFSDHDVWVVGDRVLHYDGQRWTETAGPVAGPAVLSALWGLAPDDLWATMGSRIFRWRGAGQGWVELVHGIPNPPTFNAVWALGPDDYAAGGGDVNWEIVRNQGGRLTRAYTLDATTAIWGASSDDVWAVAPFGGLWHFTGSRWSQVEPVSGGGNQPQGVWGFSAADVWVVGPWGTLQHWDGTAWTPTVLADARLSAVWGPAPDDVWAVGEEGAIWHFDGNAWSARGSVGPPVFLTGLSGSGPDSVWAVGYELNANGNHGVVFRLR